MKSEFTDILKQMELWRKHTPSMALIAENVQFWINNIQEDLDQFRKKLDHDSGGAFCEHLSSHARSIKNSKEQLLNQILLQEYEHLKNKLAKYGEIIGLYRKRSTVLAIYKSDARNPSKYPVAASIHIEPVLGYEYREALSHLEIIPTIAELYENFGDPDDQHQDWKYLCFRHPYLNIMPAQKG